MKGRNKYGNRNETKGTKQFASGAVREHEAWGKTRMLSGAWAVVYIIDEAGREQKRIEDDGWGERDGRRKSQKILPTSDL